MSSILDSLLKMQTDKPAMPNENLSALDSKEVKAIKQQYVSDPTISAATTIGWLQDKKAGGLAEGIEYIEGMRDAIARIKSGDMSDIESMLYSQAVTLQVAFQNYLTIAALNSSKPELFERYASVAARLQDQCRKTLQTLNEVKNPKRTAFIKKLQLNQLRLDSAQGELQQIQQLEASDYAEVDTGIEAATTRVDPDLAALGIEHRSSNIKRKSKKQAKRAEARASE